MSCNASYRHKCRGALGRAAPPEIAANSSATGLSRCRRLGAFPAGLELSAPAWLKWNIDGFASASTILEIVRNCPRCVTDAGLMRRARVFQAVGLGGCLLVAVTCGAPKWLQLPPDLDVADVDLPGPRGERARERIERLVEAEQAEERLVDAQLHPLEPNAPFQEQADRIVRNVADAFVMTGERAIAGLVSDEDLDKMSMSFEESLAHSAAQRDPSAPPFVRGPELIARRAQLDAKLKDIRERRAQGLPDD